MDLARREQSVNNELRLTMIDTTRRCNMRRRFLARVVVPTAVIGTALLTGVQAAAQGARPGATSAVAEKAAPSLKTPWGDPDLQGIWNASGATPMERPAAFAGRATLTNDEI